MPAAPAVTVHEFTTTSAARPPIPPPQRWRRNKVRPLPRFSSGKRFVVGKREIAAAQVESARSLLEREGRKIAEANSRRMAHPRVLGKHASGDEGGFEYGSFNDTVPLPKPEDYVPISDEVRKAAALVAEFDARNGQMEYTWPVHDSKNLTKRAPGYWLADAQHGMSPFHPDAANYKVSL